MSERLTTIYRAPNAIQAHLLKQLLAERDIPSRIVGDSIMNVESLDSPVSVLVPLAHEEIGRFIADAFDRNVIHAPPEEDDFDSTPQAWDQWPTCSACGAPRMTWCGSCGTIGNDFAAADTVGWYCDSASLLLCSVCDEPFEPKFHRKCAYCGRQFADGVECEPVSKETANDIWRSLIGAVLFLVAFVCLAWWVLRS